MEYSADLKAFNQLFADYQGRFIRFANIYVRDIAVAEDFTIEALMRIFIMSRYENKPYKEIAETLGMTTKGVEYHIAQALKKLHVNLKDYIPLLVFLSYMN